MSELPTSFSEGLQLAAAFLDLGDQLALDIARSVGSDYVPGFDDGVFVYHIYELKEDL